MCIYRYTYIYVYICINICIDTGLLTLTCMSEHVAPSSRMSDSVFQLGVGCDSGHLPSCASWQGNG